MYHDLSTCHAAKDRLLAPNEQRELQDRLTSDFEPQEGFTSDVRNIEKAFAARVPTNNSKFTWEAFLFR